jgi:spermidine synthase
MSRATARWAGLAVACGSGLAGLGYELVWTRMLATALGHELVAMLAVVAAFFVGLALGASVFGSAARRSARPALWYAALECGVALWAVALAALIPIFNERLPGWLGAEPSPARHWGLAFTATLVLLLPGSAAIGGTLPALERTLARRFSESGVATIFPE